MKGKLLEIFEINYKMSALTRFSQTHLINEESVLEHTGFVCMMSYYIGNKMNIEGKHVDLGVLMCKAVTHDMDEIITGDIPRPTKYYNEGVRSAIQEIEEENMKRISKRMQLDYMFDDWMEAKRGKEGNIVALCDGLAILYKVYYEAVMFSNRTIVDHFKHIPEFLDSIEQKIFKEHGHSDFLQSLIKEAKILCTTIAKLEK